MVTLDISQYQACVFLPREQVRALLEATPTYSGKSAILTADIKALQGAHWFRDNGVNSPTHARHTVYELRTLRDSIGSTPFHASASRVYHALKALPLPDDTLVAVPW